MQPSKFPKVVNANFDFRKEENGWFKFDQKVSKEPFFVKATDAVNVPTCKLPIILFGQDG